MSIFGSVLDTIKKYGNRVSISDGNAQVLSKGLVEPLRYKNKVYVGGKIRLLGKDQNEKYLYIGLPENKLTVDASVIESNNCKYIVKRCETYYLKDYPVYVWAIMCPYGDELEDDYESD